MENLDEFCRFLIDLVTAITCLLRLRRVLNHYVGDDDNVSDDSCDNQAEADNSTDGSDDEVA